MPERQVSIRDRVSAVVVNYQTPDLTETAVRSFRRFYPDVELLVIDNGSQDESPDVISQLSDELDITSIYLDDNRYHGPAMDLAMNRLRTPFVFLLDSDTITKKGGFMERMIDRAEPEDVYGAGKVVHVDRRGFAASDGIPVLVSAFMLLKRFLYHEFPPFVHHGLPALRNFEAAAREGYRLEAFEIDDYITHLGRGTAERYGYGLGLRSRIDYLLRRLGL